MYKAITLNESAVQPDCKQACFAIHSFVYFNILNEIIPTFPYSHTCNHESWRFSNRSMRKTSSLRVWAV